MAAAAKRSARQERRRSSRVCGVPAGAGVPAGSSYSFVVRGDHRRHHGRRPDSSLPGAGRGRFRAVLLCGEPSSCNWPNTLVFVTPLIMAGSPVACLRAGMFNIGEGQLIMGAIAATPLGFPGGWPAFVLLPLVLICGHWRRLLGWHRRRAEAVTGAHEVVTTIMLNFVAQWFLRVPDHRDRSSCPAALQVVTDRRSAQLATLSHNNSIFSCLPGAVYRAHTGIFVALAAAAVFAFLLWRTSLGYEIRAWAEPAGRPLRRISVRRTSSLAC